MSLIEEALRRIEETGASRAAQAPAVPAGPAALPASAPTASPAPASAAPRSAAPPVTASPPTEAPGLSPWIGLGIVMGAGVFLLIIGLGIGVLWNAKILRATPPLEVKHAAVVAPARVAPIAVSLPPSPAPAVAPKPWSRAPAMPTLELNGVVQGVGEPFAILNGRIVRLGETIDDAMLVEVGEDFARLQWRQEEILLRSSR